MRVPAMIIVLNRRHLVLRSPRHDPLGYARERPERALPRVLDVALGVRDVRYHVVRGGELSPVRLHHERGRGGSRGYVHGPEPGAFFPRQAAGVVHERQAAAEVLPRTSGGWLRTPHTIRWKSSGNYVDL